VKKPNLNKHWFEMLTATTGVFLLAISLLTEVARLGAATGWGQKQRDLAIWGGSLLLVAGAMLSARRLGWVTRITASEEAHTTASAVDKPLYKQLPREVIARSSVRSVLVSVIGTVFVVLVVNLAARWYLDHYAVNPSVKTVSQKWEILQNMSAPVEWLILGDSSCNQGVVPEKIESMLGGTAINLCTISPMTLLNDALMLDKYLDKFGPPKNVLIVHSYVILGEELKPLIVAKVPLPWGVSDQYRFSPELLSILEQLEISLARYFPLYFENRELRSILLDGFVSPSSLLRSEYHVDLTAKGYMPMFEPRPVDLTGILESLQKEDFLVTNISYVAIEHILALADQHGINVYITHGPMYEELYENRLFQERWAKIRAWWSDIDRRSDQVTYIGSVLTFPLNQMQGEVEHVIHSAAEMYTEKLALEIMRIQHAASSRPVRHQGE